MILSGDYATLAAMSDGQVTLMNRPSILFDTGTTEVKMALVKSDSVAPVMVWNYIFSAHFCR